MGSGLDLLTQRINRRLLTVISISVVILVLAAFVGQFFIGIFTGKNGEDLSVSAESGVVVSPSNVPALTEYLSVISTKQLFDPPEEKPQAVVKTVGIEELAKGYELTGIVELDEKEAIIKDERSRQSYFVNEGSALGELTVEKIESDKVILRYKDETHELRIV